MSRRNPKISFRSNTLIDGPLNKLQPQERWVYIGLCALCSFSRYAPYICISEELGYTDYQLAVHINSDTKTVTKVKEILASKDFGLIALSNNNIIKKELEEEWDRKLKVIMEQEGWKTEDDVDWFRIPNKGIWVANKLKEEEK